VKSIEELNKIRQEALAKMNLRTDEERIRIVVGMATCGISAGARPVLTAFLEEVSKRKLENVVVSQTGCIGLCKLEPIVEVYEPGKEKVTYIEMTPEKARRVVAQHIVNGNVVNEYTIGSYKSE
jgi:NADP-reducing hydrogenase subunit HndB